LERKKQELDGREQKLEGREKELERKEQELKRVREAVVKEEPDVHKTRNMEKSNDIDMNSNLIQHMEDM
jgi:hypothetical protein